MTSDHFRHCVQKLLLNFVIKLVMSMSYFKSCFINDYFGILLNRTVLYKTGPENSDGSLQGVWFCISESPASHKVSRL